MDTRAVAEEVIISGLTGFFDLLAQFDYEDHKKLSGLKPDLSASAPEGPGLVSVADQHNHERAEPFKETA